MKEIFFNSLILLCYVSFTAMGPILPFLPVYGKQLGISPLIMGTLTAILPIIFLIAKPAFGFLVDYFHAWRKSIFVALLAATSSCYVCMYFLPVLPGPVLLDRGSNNASCYHLPYCSPEVSFIVILNDVPEILLGYYACKPQCFFFFISGYF